MASVAVQISRLPDMGHAELLQKWKEIFSSECPCPQNRQFIIQRVAHQLQVRRYGHLDETARKRLAGYLCVEGMFFRTPDQPLLATHRKNPGTGAAESVENPYLWQASEENS